MREMGKIKINILLGIYSLLFNALLRLDPVLRRRFPMPRTSTWRDKRVAVGHHISNSKINSLHLAHLAHSRSAPLRKEGAALHLDRRRGAGRRSAHPWSPRRRALGSG